MKFNDYKSMKTHLGQFDDLLKEVQLSGEKYDE